MFYRGTGASLYDHVITKNTRNMMICKEEAMRLLKSKKTRTMLMGMIFSLLICFSAEAAGKRYLVSSNGHYGGWSGFYSPKV